MNFISSIKVQKNLLNNSKFMTQITMIFLTKQKCYKWHKNWVFLKAQLGT